MNKTLMTLRVNVLTAQADNALEVLAFAYEEGFEQFTVYKDGEVWYISAPLSFADRKRYAWLYHKHQGIAKKGQKKTTKPDGPDDNPDGTPPSGGTPGTPVLDKYVVTEARAA